jgi:uncharacterized protein
LPGLWHGFVLTRFFGNDIIRAVMPLQPAKFPLVDGLVFAAAGGRLRGAWPVSTMPRLCEELHEDAGAVEFEVQGGYDAHGRAQLALRASATLRLTCRRCLGAVDCALGAEATLLLAASQAEIDAEPISVDGPDWIVAQKAMALRDLIEDELLLALPYAPRHENCPAQGRNAPGTRHTPLAGLRGMLRSRNRH